MKGHEKASNFPIKRKKNFEKNSPSWPFLSLSLFTQQEKSLLVLRFFRDLRAFGGPSCLFFFLSLEFFKFAILPIFAIFLTFSVLLGSRKNPCYFCDFFLSLEFCLIGFSTLAIFASDCLTNFSVNYFLCEKSLLTRSFLDIYISHSFFLLHFFTHCHAIPYKPSNKAAGEVKHYHNLVLTDPGVLGTQQQVRFNSDKCACDVLGLHTFLDTLR